MTLRRTKQQQDEQPLVPEDDQQQHPQQGGQATLEPSSAEDLNTWIRHNIHYIVIFAVVAFLVLRRLRVWYLDYSSRAQISNTTPDSSINQGIASARAKQMMAAKEAQRRDNELREQRRLEDIAEKERRMKELQDQTTGTGTKNGDGSDSAPAFSERLPTLPSGRNYNPSDSWGGSGSGGGGGHYRPTGFARPRRSGG